MEAQKYKLIHLSNVDKLRKPGIMNIIKAVIVEKVRKIVKISKKPS